MRAAAESEALSTPDIHDIVRGAYLLEAAGIDVRAPLAASLADLPVARRAVKDLVASLDAILSLPMWPLRSELYSVWVGTRLISALGDKARVHHVGGAISFSTLGSHLASTPVFPAGDAHVFAELQTPLAHVTPLGTGRTRAIRPDYVLCGEPVGDPRTTLLVVECKQYLRQKTRNFAEALADYARGHPGAPVVLVSYGPTTAAVEERVARLAPDVASRTSVIGAFRPDNQEGLDTLATLVRDVAPSVSTNPSHPTTARPETEASNGSRPTSGTLQLAWTEQPMDLDLHAWLEHADADCIHVHYGRREAVEPPTRVVISPDVRTAPGSESIEWEGFDSGRIWFAVHNFSNEAPLVDSDAHVVLQTAGAEIALTVPTVGAGAWWQVLSIDASGPILVQHRVMDAPPKPVD